MFTIPENWKSFEAAELRTLATQIREAIEAAKATGEMTGEQYAEANALVASRKEILDLAKSKEALAAADLSADDEVAPAVEPEVEETEDLGDDDESAGDDAGDEDESADDGDEEVEASVKPKVRTSTGVSTTEADDSKGAEFTPDKLIAKGGVSSKPGGEAFTDWAELADTLMEVAEGLSPNASNKVRVATVPLQFDEAHTLGENMTQNLRKFDREITAALCAPTINTYDGALACMNTDRRPVRGSLAAFTPDNRGSVSIFPAPSLADITDQLPAGYGIWTSDDDDSQTGTDPSIKECAVVECATPTVYQLYALWRCLTVQNLLWMTFPELVQAYLNRLAAAHARLAETTLLEAMGTAAIDVTQSDLGYGTTTTVTSTILNMLALAEETERWDNGGMDMWAPRWLKVAMKMDIVRRRNTNGTVPSVPSDSAIDAMFRDVGVTPHWFIDSPTWSPTPAAVQTGGVLNLLPDSVGVVIAPTGKFAVMDRGELNIGVTGNNMYRDNTSNSKNQFTFFFENFEALVNTDSCPAYLLTIEDLCHNGIQIDDEVLNCDGSNTIS